MTSAEPGRISRFLAALLALGMLIAGVPALLIAASRRRFGSLNPLSDIPLPWQWDIDAIGDALASPLTDDVIVNLLVRTCLFLTWAAFIAIVVTTLFEVVHLIRHRGLSMPSIRGLGWSQQIARFIAAGLLVLVPLMSNKASLASVGSNQLQSASPDQASLVIEDSPVDEVRLNGGRSDRLDADAALTETTTPTTNDQSAASAQQPRLHIVQRGESVYSIAKMLSGGTEQQIALIANAILDANLDTEMPNGQQFTNPAYIEVGWKLIIPAHVLPVPKLDQFLLPTDTDAAPADDAVTAGNAAATHVVQVGDSLTGIAHEHLGDADLWPLVWEANSGNDMGDGRTFDDPNLILPGWELRLPHIGDLRPVDPATDEPDHADATELADARLPTVANQSAPLPTASTTIAHAPDFPADDEAHGVAEATDGSAALPPSTSATTSTSVPAVTAEPDAGGDITELPESPQAPSPVRVEHAAMLAAGVLALVGVRRRQRLRGAIPRSRVPEPTALVAATERRLRTVDSGERATRVDVAVRAAAHSLIDTDVQIGLIIVGLDGAIDLLLTGAAVLPSPFIGLHNRWSLPASVPIEMLSDDARRVGVPCVALAQVGVTDGHEVLIDIEACGTLAVEAQPEQSDTIVTALATGLATSPYAEVAHLLAVSLPDTALVGHRNAHHSPTTSEAFEMAATLVGTTVSNEQSTFALRSRRTGGEVWEPAVVLLGSRDGLDDLDAAQHAATTPPAGHGLAVVASVRPGQCIDAPVRLVAKSDGWSLVGFGDDIALTPVGVTVHELADIVELLDDTSGDLIAPDELAQCATSGPSTSDDEIIEHPDVPIRKDFVPREHSVMVRLLGGVDVIDSDGNSGAFERSKTVELIAWLATHREKSTRTAARTALWELDVRDATFANVVSEARRALGRLVTPPSGDEWLARTLSEQLPLHDHVVTDAQLAADRLEEARLQPPLQAIKTLGPAAQLIRDMPFAGTSYLWPDAEGITSSLVLLATSVTAELAAHALSLGDTDLVFWATGRGLTVLPGHEELIGLRMRAHAHAGDLAGVRQEWESYERVIVADAWSDGEPAPKLLALRRELLTPS